MLLLSLVGITFTVAVSLDTLKTSQIKAADKHSK